MGSFLQLCPPRVTPHTADCGYITRGVDDTDINSVALITVIFAIVTLLDRQPHVRARYQANDGARHDIDSSPPKNHDYVSVTRYKFMYAWHQEYLIDIKRNILNVVIYEYI